MNPSLQKTAVAAFVLALLVAALLTPNLRRFAEARGLLDQPNDSRRMHRRGIPRIGGLAVIAAFYGPLVGLLLYEPEVGQYFYSKGWVGFSFLLFTDNAGVSAIHDDRWIVYQQTILSPEPSDVVHIQVASTNNSDGLASTIESLIP